VGARETASPPLCTLKRLHVADAQKTIVAKDVVACGIRNHAIKVADARVYAFRALR